MDMPPAAELDAVVRVAAAVAGVHCASLNLFDDARQFQHTTVGFAGRDCAREDAMCAVRLDRGGFVHVPDAREEPDYRDNPWVTGKLGHIRFYASAPLISPDGYVMGTLCVFDGEPGRLGDEQIGRLTDLAGIVVAFFERNRHTRLSAGLRSVISAREEWLRTVLDNIDEPVLAVTPSGRMVLYNRAAWELHDREIDEDVEPERIATRYQLYEPDGRTLLREEDVPVLRVLRTGEPVRGQEMVIRQPGRETRRVRANARALRGRDGVVIGAAVALQDITAEHTRLRLVGEAHRRLARANAELRRSNADLTDFAGAVSHDLVAPLAAVGGYLDLLGDLRDEDGSERVALFVDEAAQAVGRMRDLIDSLLGYARAGSAPVRAVHVPMKEVLDHVLTDMNAEIVAAGARVSVPGPLPAVYGDPVLIRLLVQNLIGNALKHRRPDRPCRIEVSADGPSVRIADNGPGIPPPLRATVFDMLSRAGHGVGLPSCRRIVERHGGTITLDDTPGGGLTVTVTLPVTAGPTGQAGGGAAD
ncbi:PAS domain-containing protein [Actinoplanes sp. NEAU-H7]|uniref:Sensor-like histidine kinase SenX3 n=2 Tax=Actinoplanes flavus TaxID=2820290 RepID=A0ABS3UR49_9ACTN|nr:PAS domain-containing protein [Actinoplanes flavus]